MSPERSNSPQEEAICTPKMSVPASPVAGTPIREAQSPISLLLAVAQSQNRNGDDDLTSLSWLHEKDLLKGMNINPSPSSSTNSTPIKCTTILSDQFPTSDYVDDSSISAADSSNSSVHSFSPSYQQSSYQPAQQQQQQQQQLPQNVLNRSKHPHNIPYDPLIHTSNKPPYSFSCLIFMAIEDSPQKALPVKEIYSWILEHFPYFKNAPTGWKNSVRHNLSLNKCFQKVEKAPNLGKGSLWTVDEQYKPNLIQALTRSPFHPCSTLDPSTYINNSRVFSYNDKNLINRLPNPQLYPYLSKKLSTTAEMNNHRIKSEHSDESLDAVDAAAVMLSLKNGPKYRQKKEKHIITTVPSQDHTYSAADTPDDEAFESDDDGTMNSDICRKLTFDDEEDRKIKEGAETLLNLAGVTTRKRSIFFSSDDTNNINNNNNNINNNNNNNISLKRIKTELNDSENEQEEEEKFIPFKPRLLRTKKKENKQKLVNNNNDNEWVRNRRELEINTNR